jgi:hypothetical protein
MSARAGDVDRGHLEEERDFLLRSIEDLEAERAAGDIDESDYRALHDDYTARAARVLRRLEQVRSPKPASPAGRAVRTRAPAKPRAEGADGTNEPPADEPAAGRSGDDSAPLRPKAGRPGPHGRRRLRWAAAVAGSLALIGAAGFLVMRSSGERLPNQAATGNVPQSPLVQAEALDDAGKDPVATLRAYDAVLAATPQNVEALAREGWLLARLGKEANQPNLLGRSQTLLDKAVSLEPDYPAARAWRGLLYQYTGQPALAVCDLRAYLSLAPPDGSTVGLVQSALDGAVAAAGPTPPACPRLGPAFAPVTSTSAPGAGPPPSTGVVGPVAPAGP